MMSSNIERDIWHILRVFEKVMITQPDLRGVSGEVLTRLVRMDPHQLGQPYCLAQEWDDHSKRKFYEHGIASGSSERASNIETRIEKRTK